MLHAAFGKCSFPKDHLYANLGALTAAILAARPKGIKGGGAHLITVLSVFARKKTEEVLFSWQLVAFTLPFRPASKPVKMDAISRVWIEFVGNDLMSCRIQRKP